MLGSITSLGERSRGRRWLATYLWFITGALVGGAFLAGALLAVRAAAEILPRPVQAGLGLVGAAAVLGAALAGRPPPSLKRQVDHRWLDRYRGWVIGAGFGFQLGAGAFTLIPSFALYLLVLCALLGAPSWALICAGVSYGALRGLSAAPGGLIHQARDLHSALSVLTRWDRYVRPAGRTIDVAASMWLVALAVVAWG